MSTDCSNLLVGNLREIFVPFTDGAEEGGGFKDADFGFVFEFVYGVGGRDGDGYDDFFAHPLASHSQWRLPS